MKKIPMPLVHVLAALVFVGAITAQTNEPPMFAAQRQHQCT